MEDIIRIRPAETVRLDCGRLVLLIRSLGEAAAERTIGRSMDDISERTVRIEMAWEAGDVERLAAQAEGLVFTADRIGMDVLARVARDVCALCRVNDGPALAAAVNRLSRVAESSMVAVWGAEDVQL